MKTPSKAQVVFANEIAYALKLDFPQSAKDFTAQSYHHFISNHINDYNDMMSDDPNFDDDYWLHEEQF